MRKVSISFIENSKYIDYYNLVISDSDLTAILKKDEDFYHNASYLVDEVINDEIVKVVKLDEAKKAELVEQDSLKTIKEQRINEIQKRMNSIEQDISQTDRYGIVNDIEKLKAEFIELYKEICVLKNKEIKDIK